ncbi:MAG: hypothetical protein NUV46_04840 [Nanoarchaeota archaeon]|nr:hypothetical protein [Nanoarchaeota archaeon]
MKLNSKNEDKNSIQKLKAEKNEVLNEDKNNFLRAVLHPIFLIILSILIVVTIFLLVMNSFWQKDSSFLKCGDGTFSEYCSLKKPYYCVNQTLVENPSICGCPSEFSFRDGECVLREGVLSEFKYFNYDVYGNEGVLYLKFRPEVLDSLLALPRYQIYSQDEIPRRDDFALKKIDNSLQTESLNPLLVQIENLYPNSKDLQAKVAVSLVQNIPYNESQFISFFGQDVRVSRYPYQVLFENQGECEGKSELLVLLLKEMGFGVVLFYYPEENHEAVGIKCPIEKSYLGTGYCFIETTMPSPISFSDGRYLRADGASKLLSEPQILLIADGISLGGNLDDYSDSKSLSKILESSENNGGLNYFEKNKMDVLRKKYSLAY